MNILMFNVKIDLPLPLDKQKEGRTQNDHEYDEDRQRDPALKRIIDIPGNRFEHKLSTSHPGLYLTLHTSTDITKTVAPNAKTNPLSEYSEPFITADQHVLLV